MYTDPLAIDQIIDNVKEKSQSISSPLLRDFQSWSKWIKHQRDLFLKGKIKSDQFYERSTAFAKFIKSKLDISTDITDDLLSLNYCPSCFTKLTDIEKKRGTCAKCRRRISTNYDLNVEIPPRMDFLYSLTFVFRVLIYPKKTFQYLRYGLSNWYHVIIVYISSCFILALFSSLVVPKIIYPEEALLRRWWEHQNQAIMDVAIGYSILNLLMILFFSSLIYLFSIDATTRQSPTKTIQITSLILIPRMILLPLVALFQQLTTNQVYLFHRFDTFEEANWLLLDLSDFMGTLGVFVQPLSALLSCILLTLALHHTWGIEIDSAVQRSVLTGCIFMIIILGLPIYI
ncbi:MAG: Yip1 family protein [Candidatus Hodarchaeales archaeon]|jgi:hypothetical protein